MTNATPQRGAFGQLLQEHRLAAGLSQEQLAERAALSKRGISDLERGARRAPYPATVRRLATALGLTDAQRALLLAARLSNQATVRHVEANQADHSELPRELTSFVGREHELADLGRLLSDAPLVTIPGPGGAGKTRLALRLAHQLSDQGLFGGRAILVELAAVSDQSLVARALALSLNVITPPGEPLEHALVRALRPQHLLLVLDNCEHLIQACAELANVLLRNCARVRLLATSREPLKVPGEVVYRIPPLGLPADDRLDSLANSEVGRLFAQRAQAANSQFAPTDANAAAVAAICRRLDGLPLAIELAAARVASFAPADITSRLHNAFRIVADGPRTASPRQQTLEAAIAWSFALLDEAERQLFRSLAVFAGGFTLAGAQALATGELAALDVLPRLVAKSMVQVETQPESRVRYRLLEPLRQFAHARLVDSGELEAARRRHAEYVLELAESVRRDTHPPPLIGSSAELTAESDNIRAALEWALTETCDTRLAMRLGAVLWVWWSRPDRQAEGRAWLEQALAAADAEQIEIPLRGQVVVGLGFLSMLQGDMSTAATLSEAARRIAAGADDDALAAAASSVIHERLHGPEIDIVRALTWELPALVIFKVLGVPNEDVPRVKAWGGNRLVFLFGRTDEPTQADVAEGMVAFWRYTEDLIRERTARPRGDFTSELIQATDADGHRLSPTEVATILFGLLLAGHESTTHLLSNAVRQLLEHRSTGWTMVCREAGLIPNAVEEVLRFDSPVITWRRKTKATVRIEDVDIPADANLLLLIGSANRDASVFTAPESFDIQRPNARDHLSFGMGNHFCLGAPLARLEARVVLEELTRRCPGLQLVTPQTLTFHPNIAFRGPTSLRVALR